MKEVTIQLSSVKQVQRFVSTLTGLEGDFVLQSGQYLLDARSLMGIFGLDLSKPLTLAVYQDSATNLEALAPFMVQEEKNKHE